MNQRVKNLYRPQAMSLLCSPGFHLQAFIFSLFISKIHVLKLYYKLLSCECKVWMTLLSKLISYLSHKETFTANVLKLCWYIYNMNVQSQLKNTKWVHILTNICFIFSFIFYKSVNCFGQFNFLKTLVSFLWKTLFNTLWIPNILSINNWTV